MLITLVLVWILSRLGHTNRVWRGGPEQDLINDGDSDHGGDAVAGGDNSGWDFGAGFDGFDW